MYPEKSEKFNLFWLCSQTGKKTPAGVAFFNETQGDYRLKVDALCDYKLIFLKITSMSEGLIRYRVESVGRKGALNTQRNEIGRGYSDANGSYPIRMEIGPFSKSLIMEQAA